MYSVVCVCFEVKKKKKNRRGDDCGYVYNVHGRCIIERNRNVRIAYCVGILGIYLCYYSFMNNIRPVHDVCPQLVRFGLSQAV